MLCLTATVPICSEIIENSGHRLFISQITAWMLYDACHPLEFPNVTVISLQRPEEHA